MKLLVTKVCRGVLDTDRERQRIKKAFQKDPKTRVKLLLLMNAIEAGAWKKAQLMLDGKWWNGCDDKQGCSRLEFVGMLNLTNPEQPGSPASGFEFWAGYNDLVDAMSRDKMAGGREYAVSKVDEDNHA